jgi:predicted enzyme related to lactoylglutathione lyase
MQNRISSQIVFLYYKDLNEATAFLTDTLGLEQVEEQPFARIYRVTNSSFIGVVSGDRGFYQPQETNAVLMTLVVDDVDYWYARIKQAGVKVVKPLQQFDDIQIRCFFVEGPGGYTFELQQFLRPDMVEVFHKT